MVLAPAVFAPRRLHAAESGGRSKAKNHAPATTGSSLRRFHLAVVSVALVFAICANTIMVSSTVHMSFRRLSSNPNDKATAGRSVSQRVRSSAALALARNDAEHAGAILTSQQQRKLIKKVTRLRHKLEATVHAVQSQLDMASEKESDPTSI
jgi:ABC-type uncharacterized transport system permease subunit